MSKSGKKRKRLSRPPRAPRVVPGGIRTQNLRNLKSRAWWSRRWLETLESFALGARLGRGRSYASSGQIKELTVSAGLISATVQGAEAHPYTTRLHLRALDPASLDLFRQALRDNPVWLARLTIRDFPREFEALFDRLHCPLFPVQDHDLVMHCTCRDWVKPCKHLAALFYVLAEAVERDPHLLLLMRGVPRELVEPAPQPASAPLAAPPREQLPADFWGEHTPPFHDYGPMPQGLPVPLVRGLGPLPLWRGIERFLETMTHVNTRASALGLAVWSGEKIDFTPVEPAKQTPLFYPSRGRFKIDTTM